MGLFSATARVAAVSASALLAFSPIVATAATPARTVVITLPLSRAAHDFAGWSVAEETVNDRGWRGYRRHRGGIDGGDVLAGIIILGGIAAIAGAIDKSENERRTDRTQGRDYPDSRYPGRDDGYDYRAEPRGSDDYRGDRDPGYRTDPGAGSRYGADPRGADRAVEACTAEAARSGRVDEVFDVQRSGSEWRVQGDYSSGRTFNCTVDAQGRAYVGMGDRSARDGWDAGRGGDDEPDPQARAAGNADDDRYSTARSPDFADPRDD